MDFNETKEKTYAKPIVNRSHPPVVVSGKYASDQGEIEAGTVLAVNDTKEYVPYVPGAADSTGVIVCVSTQNINTDVATTGLVIRHGVVNAEHITPNDETTISALADLTIYAA